MKLRIDEITEVKQVSVDVDKEFIYLDKLPDGSWRLTYTKNLKDRFVLIERKKTTCKCAGWGCMACCDSEQEIRAKQGVFS